MPAKLRAVAAVLMILLFSSVLAGCSAPAPAAPPLKPGIHALTMKGGRLVTVHVPDHLVVPAPLVLVLHEYPGNGALAMGYGFDPLVDKDGFVAVYPDGFDGSWDAGGCCGDAADNGTDDVAFLTSVVKQVEARTRIDPKRVYATGFSNGAMMTYRLGCEAKLFAAIAPMSGDVETTCDHPAAASVLHIHGLTDGDVAFDPESDAPWRKSDDCGPPTVTQSGSIHRSIADCADGRNVEVVTIDGMDHQIPLADAQGFDAAPEIMAFFAAHPRP
ncbi:PHB depolymerase family esterase [Humibacter soli]